MKKIKSKMKLKNKTLLALFLTVVVATASFGQAQRDTIYTQCITGQDTTYTIHTNNGGIIPAMYVVSWSSENPAQLCDSCNSVVIPRNSPSNVYTCVIEANGSQGIIYIYAINQAAQISAVDTTSNCTIEFTSTPNTPYAVWSGVSGYTTNTNDYVITSGQASGYVYLSLTCGAKLDSIHYNGCSIDTTPVTTGIEDIKENEVSVYPNPFTDSFTISPQIPFQLFDLLGREIKLTADLPKGSYILKAKTFNKIVVKQ